jgi:hypothetical protein
MLNTAASELTPHRLAQIFLVPKNSLHRQYEALRAFFVQGLPSTQAAQRFGYAPGSFRLLCHQLRQNPTLEFFLSSRRAPCPHPPMDRVPEQIVTLRKQNLSIYDISQAFKEKGENRRPVAVSLILKEEGFARLPRRQDDERPHHPGALPATPPWDWRRIELEGVRQAYRMPRSFDRRITLPGYKASLRQLSIIDLGHEEPTLLLTSQLQRSPTQLTERYARRVLIENIIAEGIYFFHVDTLSAAHAGATGMRWPRLATSSAISSMPPLRLLSPKSICSSDSKSALTTLCFSPPASSKRGCPSPGPAESNFASSSMRRSRC